MILQFDTKLPALKTDAYPSGICPFMSGRPVMVPAPPSSIAQPGQQAVSMALAMVPCAGSQCQLWVKDSVGSGYCTVNRPGVELAGISDHVFELSRQLEPPRGDSPAKSVAGDLRRLVDLVEKGVTVKKFS